MPYYHDYESRKAYDKGQRDWPHRSYDFDRYSGRERDRAYFEGQDQAERDDRERREREEYERQMEERLAHERLMEEQRRYEEEEYYRQMEEEQSHEEEPPVE